MDTEPSNVKEVIQQSGPSRAEIRRNCDERKLYSDKLKWDGELKLDWYEENFGLKILNEKEFENLRGWQVLKTQY